MEYVRRNVGTCSMATRVVLDDQGVITTAEVAGGCNGNLQGICRLITGMRAEDAIAKMKGVRCGHRPTSCPDQIAITLEEALAKQKA